MSIYTVNYSKRNSFFKRSHDIMEVGDDGRKNVIGKYNKPNAPGSVRIYKPDFKRGITDKFLIDMEQDELNDLVKEIGLLNANGDMIETANLKNIGDKFFTHSDVYLRMEGGGVTLNDDVPMDKFFLSCLKADPRFKFVDEEVNPAMSAMVEFTITIAGGVSVEETKETDLGLEAMELFLSMTFEKRVQIINSMGVTTKNPDPERIKNALYKKITKEKDQINPITGETSMQFFLRLAKSSTEELSLRALVGDARNSRIIGKKSGGKYVYGDLELGRNLDEVYSYLSNDENVDIKTQIIKSLKQNG